MRPNSLSSSWLIMPIILMLAFALRLSNLELLPIFYDEAVYLEWARKTHDRLDLSIALNEVSTFQVWLIALFYGVSPSALWVGRFVSAMAGVLTAALCYAIAWQLYANKRVAQLAALLYAVVPYAVFHDRLAQNDGILALFLALFELDLSSVQGKVCLYTGIYRRSTGERLPAHQADQALPDNAILLACGDVG
jgi:4-amino-4-deoxy-L-arabinose transferase-like glycosyltransferase